jgi:hypothetical protein
MTGPAADSMCRACDKESGGDEDAEGKKWRKKYQEQEEAP